MTWTHQCKCNHCGAVLSDSKEPQKDKATYSFVVRWEDEKHPLIVASGDLCSKCEKVFRNLVTGFFEEQNVA